MYIINEKQNTSGTYFEKQIFDGQNKLTDTHRIQVCSFNTTTDDGMPITMIYNSKMQPIETAIQFINFGGMKDQSQNYILQAISSLKFLYSYLEIYSIDLEDMSKKDAVGFLDFLKGVSREGLLYTTNLTTKRKNETVSSYLKVARKYVEYLGFDDHVLLSKNNAIKTIIMPESDGAKSVQPYSISVKTPKRSDYVPAYVNISEYKDLLEATNNSPTPLRDRVICRLLFEHGLRIGEVLGLTIEDIKSKENKDFTVQYKIELRNRVSDSNEQNAKSVMNVTSADIYKHPDYIRKDIGYQSIIISESLAMDLLEYINTAHDLENEKYMARREKFAKADSVPHGNPDVKHNYYVFLNTLGRPLSENLWDKNLRVIFKNAGLKVDSGVREHNLNHRLRHGYAMYLTDVLKVSDFDVKTLMRHKSLSSTAIYHNPTPSDTDRLQEQLIEKWDISLLKDGEE